MALTACEKFGYGLGHVCNDLCAAFWFTYSLIFYEVVLEFSSVDAGALMLIGQVADALATPVIGVVSDRTYLFSIFGKRKTLHLVGTAGTLLTWPFIYSPCIGCGQAAEWIRFLYYSIIIIIFQFVWAASQIAHLAMATVLSEDEIERTELFSIRNAFTCLSSIFTYAIAWGVFCMKKNNSRVTPNDTSKFQVIDFTIGVLGAYMSLIFHLTVHENIEDRHGPLSANGKNRSNFKEIFSKWFLYQAAIMYAVARVFCNVSQAMISLYLHEYLMLKKESIAIIPFVIFTISFMISWVVPYMSQLLGAKLAFSVGCVIGIGTCLWIYFGNGYAYNTYFIYVISVLLGATYSILMISSLAITAELIGRDTGNSAFIYGLMSFFEKLANGIAIMIIQSLNPSKPDKHVQTSFHRNAIVIVCGSSAVLGLICAFSIKTSRSRE